MEIVDTDAVEMEFDGPRQAVQEICDIVLLPSEGLVPIVCDATHAPDAIPTLAVRRDGASREQIEARMRNQMDPAEMSRLADHTVLADGVESLRRQAAEIDNIIRKM